MASILSAEIVSASSSSVDLSWEIDWNDCDNEFNHSVTIQFMGDDSDFWESIIDGGDDRLRFYGRRVDPRWGSSYRVIFEVNTNEDFIGRDEIYAILELQSVRHASLRPERRRIRTSNFFVG